nr:hypothetical protein [Acidobacterium sp. S8]
MWRPSDHLREPHHCGLGRVFENEVLETIFGMHVELLHLALNEKPGRVELLVTQGKRRFANVFIELCEIGDVPFAARVDCADSERFKSAIDVGVHFC